MANISTKENTVSKTALTKLQLFATTVGYFMALALILTLMTPFLPISPFSLICLATPVLRMIKMIPNVPTSLNKIGITTQNEYMLATLGLIATHLILSTISPYFRSFGLLNALFLADFAILGIFMAICTHGIPAIWKGPQSQIEKTVFTTSLATCGFYAAQKMAFGLLQHLSLPDFLVSPLALITAVPTPLVSILLLGFSLYHLHFSVLNMPSLQQPLQLISSTILSAFAPIFRAYDRVYSSSRTPGPPG